MVEIREHGVGVVAPNGEIRDLTRGTANFVGNLCLATVLIQTGHRMELTVWNIEQRGTRSAHWYCKDYRPPKP